MDTMAAYKSYEIAVLNSAVGRWENTHQDGKEENKPKKLGIPTTIALIQVYGCNLSSLTSRFSNSNGLQHGKHMKNNFSEILTPGGRANLELPL